MKRMLLTLFLVLTCAFLGADKEVLAVSETGSAILLNAEQTDDTGILKYIPNETIEQGIMQKILGYKDNFLLYGSTWDQEKGASVLQLKLIDRKTGEVLKENSLEGVNIANVQICSDVLVVTDTQDGEVHFLDEELNIANGYKIAVENSSIYVDSSGKKIYCFTQENGIKCIDTETNEETVCFENATGLFPSNAYGDHVTFTYTDKETQLSGCARIDLATGETEIMPFEGTFYDISYNGEIWIGSLFGEETIYYIGKSQRPNILRPDDSVLFIELMEDPESILINSYNRDGFMNLKLYGLDGRFLSECSLPIGYSGTNHTPIWSEEDNGYFFTVIDDTGKDLLMFWDMTVPVSGQSLQFEAILAEAVIGDVVSEELYQKAAELSEKYQLEIRIAEQCAEEVSDYTFVKELDETYIQEGLQTLEKALAAYPEGFFAQLPHSSYKTIEVHLVGGMQKKELPAEGSGGFGSTVGVVCEMEGKLLLAVDIVRPGGVEQTMHHEIMHLTDRKLEFDAKMREGALYSEEGWNALNPEGFSYLETYDSVPDSVYNDGYGLYFIDIYSRTFAKEDRARIMEYGMINADWMFIACEERTAKLQYLSDCIRDAFNTDGWPEVTVWEQTLAMVK